MTIEAPDKSFLRGRTLSKWLRVVVLVSSCGAGVALFQRCADRELAPPEHQYEESAADVLASEPEQVSGVSQALVTRTPLPQVAEATVEVRVVCARTQAPLKDATVHAATDRRPVYGEAEVTHLGVSGLDGIVWIEGPRLREVMPSARFLVVSRDGYDAARFALEDGSCAYRCALVESCLLNVQVKGPLGEPVAKARVIAFARGLDEQAASATSAPVPFVQVPSEDAAYAIALSDESGNARLRVQAGTYKVFASCKGYLPSAIPRQVQTTPGSPAEVVVRMAAVLVCGYTSAAETKERIMGYRLEEAALGGRLRPWNNVFAIRWLKRAEEELQLAHGGWVHVMPWWRDRANGDVGVEFTALIDGAGWVSRRLPVREYANFAPEVVSGVGSQKDMGGFVLRPPPGLRAELDECAIHGVAQDPFAKQDVRLDLDWNRRYRVPAGPYRLVSEVIGDWRTIEVVAGECLEVPVQTEQVGCTVVLSVRYTDGMTPWGCQIHITNEAAGVRRFVAPSTPGHWPVKLSEGVYTFEVRAGAKRMRLERVVITTATREVVLPLQRN